MTNQTNTTPAASGGTSILGMLGVALVILKLIGIITWPWLWVLAPFWVPFAIVAALIPVALVVAVIAAVVKSSKN